MKLLILISYFTLTVDFMRAAKEDENVVIRTVSYSKCLWVVDYTISRDPYRLWSVYFDEISEHDESHDLNTPNALKYLVKSVLPGATGHYIFPFYVVIRPFCEDGFYDETVYKYIYSGNSPTVKISYLPKSSRQVHTHLMYAVFQSALVNLKRKRPEDLAYIPQNSLNRPHPETGEYDGESGCPLNICYPAFVVPQVLLHIPIIKVDVPGNQGFRTLAVNGASSPFHERDVPGLGRLKVASKNHPLPSEFFPVRRVTPEEDTQFAYLKPSLPDYDKNAGRPGGSRQIDLPELEHITDHNCVPFPKNETFGGNPYAPLDTEDFMKVEYTYGNAPAVVIAGFYDPNLLIIGDPDLTKFSLVRWSFEATGGTHDEPTARLFTSRYPCFSDNYEVMGFRKPLFSQVDRADAEFALQFYRMRYTPKNYTNISATKGIFGALTLEDRILLVTTSGIVSFYQNTNKTSNEGKAWEVEGADRLEKCFKIVRIARRNHGNSDTIVAITYDYQEFNPKTKVTTDVSQQIWIGSYRADGIPIKWREVGAGASGETLKEERVFNEAGHSGELVDLPDQKIIGVPVERREANPKSQIEAICYKTYRSRMGKASHIELIEDQGWCDVVDATPVVSIESTIQVLVRMKVYYSGGQEAGGGAGSHGGGGTRRMVVFYIIASFNSDKIASRASIWHIDAIIPRIPCLNEHQESIPNVVQYNMDYFRKGDPEKVGSDHGCHTGNLPAKDHLYLHGITYTRSYNHHMFLYGNKLLHSTDGGATFVYLSSFPERGDKYICKDSYARYHVIKIMTFDDLGHYAFLTSKREMWYGNVGSLNPIRLNPSPSFSMIQTRLPYIMEMNTGVPFGLFFDSSNRLVELVAVVDKNGTVNRIFPNIVNERTILRARYFIEQIGKTGDNLIGKLKTHIKATSAGGTPLLDPSFMQDIRFNPQKWSVFCPYASPSYFHNFTRHSRAQSFNFPVPKQHPQLGHYHQKTSLYVFQAVAFGLVWSSFFNEPYRSYSFQELDTFDTWLKKRDDVAEIGRLQYLSHKPSIDGILVEPRKYRRFYTNVADAKRIYEIYYMDYGVTLRWEIEYSITNDYSLTAVDYENHRLSDVIHLNVDNSNGSLIQVNTEKEIIAGRAAVRYVIHVSVKKNTGLQQRKSGRQMIQVPIILHLIGGFGKCIKTESSGILGDSISTAVSVGCPPSADLVFDWNSTLHSIKFRDPTAHYGALPKECYNGEQFCFFARYPLVPHFHIFDNAKQSHYNFSGRYLLKIIAGGYSRNQMKTYSNEEQEAYNVPGISDVSLIWNEWDRKLHQKAERKNFGGDLGRNDSREVVLRAGVSAVQWACHTLSPCARIAPRRTLESVYYFRVFVTNRGVDNDTLCLFEKEFTLLLYGFPPSPELQLITTVLFYLCMLATLYVLYFCFRNHKKLWRSTEMKVYGWFQIVKDTLPKFCTKSDVGEEETEAEEQKRRDDILLSLQGHLKVPPIYRKHTQAPNDGLLNPSTGRSSFSSFKSVASPTESQPNVINPVANRPVATTWTDLIYEQIISRRLAAIIERNRGKAETVRKKTEESEK